MFKRKWHWALTVIIILCLGGITFLLTPKIENQEPIKIYTAVTQDPETNANKENNKTKTETTAEHSPDYKHGHPHETLPHSPVEETNTGSDEYDWQDDSTFDVTLSKSDPWMQTYPEQESTDVTDDTYPPQDWYKTEDPQLRAEYFYAQLLKQFGNIPEVHTVGEHRLQMAQKVPIHIDKYIEYLEACNTLWPDPDTSSLINDMRKDKAKGIKFIFK